MSLDVPTGTLQWTVQPCGIEVGTRLERDHGRRISSVIASSRLLRGPKQDDGQPRNRQNAPRSRARVERLLAGDQLADALDDGSCEGSA
jgi:hypothetical protein